MRKVLSVLLGVVMIAALTGVALATPSASKTAPVYVTVLPHIQVLAPTSVPTTSIQTGQFSLSALFRIDANQQNISICGAASKLYKGDVITSPWSIPLVASKGIVVACERANAMNGQSNTLTYVGPDPDGLDGYPGDKTVCRTFESGDSNHFSQSCSLTPTWDQIDPELPQGQYSGKIKIYLSTTL